MPLTAEEKRAKCREYNKHYRERHKEEIAAYNKRYREANKEKFAEYQRQYIAKNRDRHNKYMREYLRKYYAKHGGYMYPKRRWQEWEIELVLDHDLTNAELSPLLERSANAINAKRCELKKQLEMLSLSWK